MRSQRRVRLMLSLLRLCSLSARPRYHVSCWSLSRIHSADLFGEVLFDCDPFRLHGGCDQIVFTVLPIIQRATTGAQAPGQYLGVGKFPAGLPR